MITNLERINNHRDNRRDKSLNGALALLAWQNFAKSETIENGVD